MLEKLPHALGEALQSVRPGVEATLWATSTLADIPPSMTLSSPSFSDGQPLDIRFTADGAGVSPPLRWSGIPTAAVELLLIVEDADSPTPHPLVHAIAHGMAPTEGDLAEAALAANTFGEGRNSFLKTGWLPPDPPTGHGTHRYVFQLYALSTRTDLTTTLGRTEAYRIVKASAIARGSLIGTYQRP